MNPYAVININTVGRKTRCRKFIFHFSHPLRHFSWFISATELFLHHIYKLEKSVHARVSIEVVYLHRLTFMISAFLTESAPFLFCNRLSCTTGSWFCLFVFGFLIRYNKLSGFRKKWEIWKILDCKILHEKIVLDLGCYLVSTELIFAKHPFLKH